jgi:hypothetical protein
MRLDSLPAFSASLDNVEECVRAFLKGRETTETVLLTAVLRDFAVFFAAVEATERREGERRDSEE